MNWTHDIQTGVKGLRKLFKGFIRVHRKYQQSKFLYIYILCRLRISLHLHASWSFYICLYYSYDFFSDLNFFSVFLFFKPCLWPTLETYIHIHECKCRIYYGTIRKWKQIGNQSYEIPSPIDLKSKKLVLRYRAFYSNILYFLLPPSNDNIFLQIKFYFLI